MTRDLNPVVRFFNSKARFLQRKHIVLLVVLFNITIVNGQLPVLSWVNAAGSVGNSVYYFQHAVDSNENVFVGGAFTTSSIDFDTGNSVYPLQYYGGEDIFLGKYDPQGNLLWAFSIGSNSGNFNEIIYSVEASPTGEVYVSGLAQPGADFDPSPGTFIQPSGTYGFIAKYDAQGNLLWCSPMNIHAHDMKVDHAGNLLVTGYYNDTVDVDPGSSTFNLTSIYGEDVFVAKYNPSGSLLWAFSLNSTFASNCIGARGWSIENDAQDNVIVHGRFRAAVDFDPGPATQTLASQITTSPSFFIAKYSSSGNYIWAFNFDLNIYNSSIAVDPSDNIIVGMTFGATDDIDPGPANYPFTPSDPGDLGLIKYSASGNLIWAQLIPGSGVEYFRGISTNASSDIYISGFMMNSVDFDPGPGQTVVAPNGFIAKYTSQCNLLWAFSIVGEGNHALEMPSGAIHWVGRMPLCADFDPSAAVQNLCPGYTSGNGIFVAKYLQPTVSIGNELLNTATLNVFPNPACDNISIVGQSTIISVEILNSIGASVLSQTYNSQSVIMDISSLDSGIYLVNVNTSEGKFARTLCISR